MDGKVAHKPNGAQLNGHAPSPKPRYQRERRPGFLSTVFSVSARILIWTTIINVLFRCPSTPDQCDDSSPYGCKEYFKVKEIVSPHLQPYYDTHVSPYVDLAAPYYEALDRAVITPANTYTRKYASPLIAYGNGVAQQQWEKIVQPQIETARAAARAKYNETIAPHVTSFRDTASPYVDIARTSALQTYHDLILPTYVFMQPYAVQGYNAASAFATNTALPSAIWAFNKTWLFLDDAILPQLRLIYVQTVEPQLVRIGQRLGRYNGGGKTKMAATEPISATATATRSFFTKPSPCCHPPPPRLRPRLILLPPPSSLRLHHQKLLLAPLLAREKCPPHLPLGQIFSSSRPRSSRASPNFASRSVKKSPKISFHGRTNSWRLPKMVLPRSRIALLIFASA